MNPLRPSFLTLTFWLLAGLGCAQDGPSPCSALKSRLDDALLQATAVERFRRLVAILATKPDDPEDCVMSKIRAELVKSESSLVSLEIEGKQIPPDSLLYCNEIKTPAQVCIGPALDTSILMPEEKLAAHRETSSRPRPAIVRLRFSPNTPARVVGVFGGMTFELQNGKSPTPLPYTSGVIRAKALQKAAGPVIIVIYQRTDVLGLRKALWHL